VGSVVEKIYYLILKLNNYEVGYIRFDYDPSGENGEIHPLYHFDVNCVENATFKIGLNGKWDSYDMFDLFDSTTKCYFINKEL
jgi:hypothetical protein